MPQAPLDVLFLAQRVPYPPDRGDRITTFHFLRHYATLGARLRIAGFAEEPRDVEAGRILERELTDLGAAEVEVTAPRLDRRLRKLTSLRALATGGPLTLPFFRHSGLRSTIDRWIRERPPAVVHVYSSSMAQYCMRNDCGVRLMQFAELDSDKWRQYADSASNPLFAWLYRREARRLLAFEAEVARTFDTSFVCSPVERELFVERIPDAAPPVVLPNGVDVGHFSPGPDPQRGPHTLIFTGVMDYEPNVDGVLWFVADAWPRIRSRHPDAELLVVGSRPCPAIRELDGRDGIRVTGRVETTPPWFDRASVAIAPLRLARGVQNKVLEAMSMGLPVVSSPQAAQGIERADDSGSTATDPLIVADDMPATADAVLRLFADPAAARALGERAAEFVRARYRWESMFDRLDAVLTERGVRWS